MSTQRRHILLSKPPTVVALNNPVGPDDYGRVRFAAELVVLGPGLKLAEVELLARCPYESPGFVHKQEARIAAKLRRMGLLEKDENAFYRAHRGTHRCTELGIEVVQAYAKAGFLGPAAKKRWALVGQSCTVGALDEAGK